MKKFYDSPEFKAAAKSAEPFFHLAHDFVFGDRPLILENAVCTSRKRMGAKMLTYNTIGQRTVYLPWQSDSVLFVTFIRSTTT